MTQAPSYLAGAIKRPKYIIMLKQLLYQADCGYYWSVLVPGRNKISDS
jgi:hypothetical protein